MQFDKSFLVLFLNDAFEKKVKKNKNFSKRAFAKQLGIDPALLSKIMRGDRSISRVVQKKIVQHFSFADNLAESPKTKLPSHPQKELLKLSEKDSEFFLNGWEPYSFLARMRSGNFGGDYSDLAKEFGVNLSYAKQIYEHILNLGRFKKDAKGYWTSSPFLPTNDPGGTHSKSALLTARKHQKALLEKAARIACSDFDHSHFSSMIFTMSPELLGFAKTLSRLYRRQMISVLGDRQLPVNDAEVYVLQVGLFPLKAKP